MDEATIDLRNIIKVLKKRRRLILSIFAGFSLVALIISFLLPPTYEAETTLRIKQSKGLSDSLLSDLAVINPMNTKQLMSTYAEIIKSRTVIQEVIDKTQSEKQEIPEYKDFIKTITTKPVKDTEILDVSVQASTPEEAQNVANVLVDTFLKRLTTLVRSEQGAVRQFIGERLADSKQELETAEAALEQYKREQMIVDADAESKALVDRMATIDKLSADNKVALAAAEAKLASANQQLGEEKDGFIADNAVIQQYKSKLADLEIQRVGLMQNYTDQHPKLQEVNAAIAEAHSRLNAEIARVVSADAPSVNPVHQGLLQTKLEAEAETSVYSAQRNAIDAILGDNEKQLADIPAKQHGLVKAMRDANVAQEIYIMLAKRHEEARISEVMEPTDVQIVDAAIMPEKPVKPRKMLNTLVGAVLGLFLGTGLAFVLEHMNKTIRTAEDVQQYLDLPILGSIPDFAEKQERKKQGLFMRINNRFSRNKQHHT
ncbi:hypothetical protein P22_0544 [Propionispora sp. 2/2-37]|uniref:GumC family protein n=1 Tax=Propionispora sp. 2/2-37 TaxID=1677858 RepID=UPI0006BB7997|nr:Wzz/FepE/Etk N-terminal domain-containing protein [Propionispora sp. 2/2-37]CUH94478.1 hypothetical protein P22_0544 [Propionispora sp. 2/2-37]